MIIISKLIDKLFRKKIAEISQEVKDIKQKLKYFDHLELKLDTIISHLSEENSFINMNISTIRHTTSVPFWEQEIRANQLIETLKISKPLKLKRIGSINDGGYFVPEDILKKVKVAVNIGIGSEVSLDEDLLRLGKYIYAYDPFLEKHPISSSNIMFMQKGLGSNVVDKNISLTEINNSLTKLTNEEICLFIDIEGDEWNHFKNSLEIDSLSKYGFLVIEFHNLLNKISKLDSEEFHLILKILNQIKSYFEISHINGNNSSASLYFNGRTFPDVIEVTFVNKLLALEVIEMSKLYNYNSANDKNKPPLNLNNWF